MKPTSPIERESWNREVYAFQIQRFRGEARRLQGEAGKLDAHANQLRSEMVKFEVSDLPLLKGTRH